MFNVEKLRSLTEVGQQRSRRKQEGYLNKTNYLIALQKENPEAFLKIFLKDAWSHAQHSAKEGKTFLLVADLDDEEYEFNPENPDQLEPEQLRGLSYRVYKYFEQKGLTVNIKKRMGCNDSLRNVDVFDNNNRFCLYIDWSTH